MTFRWVVPQAVEEDLAAASLATGRPKSRLVEEVWARERGTVLALAPGSDATRRGQPADVRVAEMRDAAVPLQAARESAALGGGRFPIGWREEQLFCREAFLRELSRESDRLGVDESALLLFCWRRQEDRARGRGGYSWNAAVSRRLLADD
jgi:hypothetical protein